MLERGKLAADLPQSSVDRRGMDSQNRGDLPIRGSEREVPQEAGLLGCGHLSTCRDRRFLDACRVLTRGCPGRALSFRRPPSLRIAKETSDRDEFLSDLFAGPFSQGRHLPEQDLAELLVVGHELALPQHLFDLPADGNVVDDLDGLGDRRQRDILDLRTPSGRVELMTEVGVPVDPESTPRIPPRCGTRMDNGALRVPRP